MISDKEWLRKLGEWIDWQDESFGERELRNYMMLYDFARLHKAIRKECERTKEDLFCDRHQVIFSEDKCPYCEREKEEEL